MKWNLRWVAARQDIWRPSDLKIAFEAVGFTPSLSKVCALWSARPVTVRLDDLDMICAALKCTVADLMEAEPLAGGESGEQEGQQAAGQGPGAGSGRRRTAPPAELSRVARVNRPGSCGLCVIWGTITGSGLCYECRSGRYERARGGLREAVCRRCGWPGIVGADGTCRGCRIAVRLGQHPAWMHAEFERRDLPDGRPLQLAVRIEGLALNSNPLRHRAATGPRQRLAPWARGRIPPALDDPAVCVEEVPGQLGLFAPWPRTYTRAHGKRIQRHLLLDDLDHSRATLRVRRTGKPVHTVYLDELTYRLARQWLAERHRRRPATTSPYLLVTAHTATDDPLHLIRLFGLSPRTAMKYIHAAHPHRSQSDPIMS